MSVHSDIKQLKTLLIKRASKKGVYENFGQKELNFLEEEYSDHQYKNDGIWEAVRSFDNWCMNYTGE